MGWSELSLGATPMEPRRVVIADRDEPMVLPTELADVAQALPGVAKVEPPSPVTATALVSTKAAVMPPPAKLSMTALLAPPPPIKAPDVATAVRTDDIQATRDAVRAASENRHLMVLGSFKGPEMAGRLAKLHMGLGAKVVKADVNGQTYFRVVVEPEKGARLQQRLTGADKPWLIPVQTASIAGTLR